MSSETKFDKAKFIRLMMSSVQDVSASTEKARAYLEEEGHDVDALVTKGVSKISQLQQSLQKSNTKESTGQMPVAYAYSHRKNWTHKSVKKLIEESGNPNPLEEIKIRTRNLVLQAFEKGWQGPPYSPVQLAEYLGINVIPNDSVTDARILPVAKGFQIQYNPFQRQTRLNFSVSHEIIHTLFSDCAEAIRNREETPLENRELEQLCNAGAAEIQLPYAVFSHDANSVEPSIEGLISLATKYKASLESVFIRYTEVIDRPCAILIGIFQSDDSIVVDYYKSSTQFEFGLPDCFELPKDSVAYECTAPGWTSRERVSWQIFEGKSYNLFAIGITPYRKDNRPRVGILLLPTDSQEIAMDKGKVVLEFGDATKPRGAGNKIIAQVVNTGAALGRGFGYALAKNFPVVKDALKKWYADKSSFVMGSSNLVKVADKLYVFQMLAQKGIFPKPGEIPLKYHELRKCLAELREAAQAHDASVHMPAIGAGNAGGDWNIIIGMIHDELIKFDVKVNIYLIPGKPFDPRHKTTLTVFKEESTWETGKLF
jgi:hypothetical protein